MRRTSLTLDPVVVSDSFEFLRSHAITENIIAFQIPIGLPAVDEQPGVVSRLVDTGTSRRDCLIWPIARARLAGRGGAFHPQMMEHFESRFECH